MLQTAQQHCQPCSMQSAMCSSAERYLKVTIDHAVVSPPSVGLCVTYQ